MFSFEWLKNETAPTNEYSEPEQLDLNFKVPLYGLLGTHHIFFGGERSICYPDKIYLSNSFGGGVDFLVFILSHIPRYLGTNFSYEARCLGLFLDC